MVLRGVQLGTLATSMEMVRKIWLLSLCCYRVEFRGRCRVVATQGRRVWLWLLCRTFGCDGFEGLAARHPAMTRPLIERRDMIAARRRGYVLGSTEPTDWRLFLVHLWAGIDAGKAINTAL